jgi:ubiquinone biosynthesis protein
MIFIDGAIVRLAPDIDLFAEVGRVYGYFAIRHGARIMSEIGFDPASNPFDPTNLRAQLGLEDGVGSLTHRELRERRAILQKRVEGAGGLPGVD